MKVGIDKKMPNILQKTRGVTEIRLCSFSKFRALELEAPLEG